MSEIRINQPHLGPSEILADFEDHEFVAAASGGAALAISRFEGRDDLSSGPVSFENETDQIDIRAIINQITAPQALQCAFQDRQGLTQSLPVGAGHFDVDEVDLNFAVHLSPSVTEGFNPSGAGR